MSMTHRTIPLHRQWIYLMGTINDIALSSPDTNLVIGWFSFDEPDDAQKLILQTTDHVLALP